MLLFNAWLSSLLAALATLPTPTFAQTSTSCNPLQKTCPADTAIASTLETTFTGVSSLPSGWTAVSGTATFDSNGAEFTINKQGDSPTIQTTGYFFFGYAEVTMKAASGQGIVSSIVLESDDLDEVDWELTGTDTTQVQSNYFGKGNTATYNRAVWHPVSTPQSTFHTYAVNWTSSQLTWLIDGVAVRTLNYADAAGGSQFPQTPMRLKLGIWAGGDPSNGEGTIEWAGGETNYADAPFTMTVQSVKVVNYAPASSYSYGDTTGSWQSIKVVGGSSDSPSSEGTGSSSASITTGSTAATSATTAVSSNSDIFQISTATANISTSTAGAVTTSAPAITPLLGATTASSSTLKTSGTVTSHTSTQTASGAGPQADYCAVWLLMTTALFAIAL